MVDEPRYLRTGTAASAHEAAELTEARGHADVHRIAPALAAALTEHGDDLVESLRALAMVVTHALLAVARAARDGEVNEQHQVEWRVSGHGPGLATARRAGACRSDTRRRAIDRRHSDRP